MHHLPRSNTAYLQAILSAHEAYIDCYLRLACIARRMGSATEARSWAEKALELHDGHADALALMSQLHMERRWVLACR